jgi:hypothetical protein
MASWEFDRRRFTEEVFLPVGAGWNPEDDWFRCYQLPVDTDDTALIRDALDTVRNHLNRSQLGGPHAATANYLSTMHAAARETLLDPELRAAHRGKVLAARAPLVTTVRSEARGMSAVPPRVADAIARRFAGRFTEGDVRAVLRDLGVAVREPVELDVPAASTRLAGLRPALAALRARSLGEYLRAPERRLGADPTERALAARRAAIDSGLSGDAHTAEEKVLTALQRWAAGGELPDVLRGDCVDALGGEAVLGPEHLEAQLRRPDVRRYLNDLGLPGPDDLAYALLCRALFPTDTSSRWQADVESALVAHDLRRALALLQARPGLPSGYAARRDELAGVLEQVDAQLRRARDLEGDDPEAAAELYSTVLRSCADPAAEDGLRRCRPAPPRSARSVVDGTAVRVEWEASAARVGDITYAVVRDDGTPVAADASALAVVDASAPSGMPLTYTVTTLRDALPGGTVTTQPVVVLRPVTDLELVPGDGVVEIRWTLPDGAHGVRVTRAEDGGPACEITGNATRSLRDTAVRTGRSYVYAVSARYRVDEQELSAVPVTGRIRPQVPPRPVEDLRADRDGDDVVLRWTAPPAGDVRILVLTTAPPEPVGHVMVRSAVDRLGIPVGGRAVGDGLRIGAPASGSRYWFVPLTVTDDLAVIGTAVPYDVRLPQVTGLALAQQGSRVRVTWTWPPGAAEARAYRKEGAPITGPDDPAATTRRITYAEYLRVGCHLPAAAAECWFGVGLVALAGGEEIAGPVEQRAFTGLRELRYEIRAVPGWGKRRHRVVELHTDSGPLPAVQIRGRVDLPPLRPDDGQELARFDAPEPGATRLHGEFTLPAEGRPLHLRAYALGTPGVVLVPARPAQLRIDPRRSAGRARTRMRRRGLRCPYCWKPIERTALLRRCPERCAGGGQTMEYFPSTATACPHGDEPSAARFCPHCRKRVEHDYLATPGRIIATIGSSDSGKSTAIGVLIKELRDRVGDELGGMTTELVGDASRDRYREVFEKPLLEEGRTLARTDSVRAAQRLDPLLFMIRRPRGVAWWNRHRIVANMNVFYDTAGEDVLRETSMGPLVSYLDAADAIVFVLDPLQVTSVRRSVGDASALPDAASNQVDILARTAELLRERRGQRSTDRITTPLAVVLTKTDALPDLLPAGCALTRPGTHDGAYDEADGRYVHDEVRAVLSEWTDGRRLLDAVERTFPDHRFFGVSALGTSPASRTDLAEGGIRPLRVEDPMLWLLARFGLIPLRSPQR